MYSQRSCNSYDCMTAIKRCLLLQASPSAMAADAPLTSSDQLPNGHDKSLSAPQPAAKPSLAILSTDAAFSQASQGPGEETELQQLLSPHADSADESSLSAAAEPFAQLSEQQAAAAERPSPDLDQLVGQNASEATQQLSPPQQDVPDVSLSAGVPHELQRSFSSFDGSPQRYPLAAHDSSRHFTVSQGLEAQLSDAESSAAQLAGGESSGARLAGDASSAEDLADTASTDGVTPAAAAVPALPGGTSASMSDNQAYYLGQPDDAMPIANSASHGESAAAAQTDKSATAAAAHDSARPVTPAHAMNPLYDSPHPSPTPSATNPLYNEPQQQTSVPSLGQSEDPILEAIFVYPIKSCAGFSPEKWPLGPNGLLYDREWALVDEAGAALTQKRHPKLAMLQPRIDLQAGRHS